MKEYKDLLRENRKLKKWLSENIKTYRENLIKVETSWGNIVRFDKLILREEIKQGITPLVLIVSLSALWIIDNLFLGRWILGTIWVIIGSLWGFLLVNKIKQLRKLKNEN